MNYDLRPQTSQTTLRKKRQKFAINQKLATRNHVLMAVEQLEARGDKNLVETGTPKLTSWKRNNASTMFWLSS